MSYDFIPAGQGEAIHRDCVFELEQFPEDLTEPDIELHAARRRGPTSRFSGRRRQPRPAAVRHRAGSHFHRLLHPGERLHATRPALSYHSVTRQVVSDAEATRLLRGRTGRRIGIRRCEG